MKKNNDFYSSGFLLNDNIEDSKINIPKDYIPDWRLRQPSETQENSAISVNRRKLDANLRAQILGESTGQAQAPVESKFAPIDTGLNNNFSEGTALPANAVTQNEEDNLKGTKHLLVDIPFKNDKDKIQRFKNYIEEQENNMIVTDTSSNMMTGSQLRKEKEEFAELYKLELALRNEKQKGGKYASEVVSSKQHRDEITEEKKQALIEEIEQAKKAITKTIDWQPNALLCKRFGLLDPFKNKKPQRDDFNKNPYRQRPSKGGVEFVTESEGRPDKNSFKGDSFFYKIQRSFNRNEVVQKVLDKGEKTGSEYATKVHDLKGGYVEVESDSGSDMEIEDIDPKENMNNVITLAKRPDQNVFDDIFNSDNEGE